MDERSVEWLWLLPPQPQIELRRAPEALGALLEPHVSDAPDTLVACEARPDDIAGMQRYRAAALLRPQGDARPALRAAGFRYVDRYCVLPSLRDARWILPLESRPSALRALDFIGGFRAAGKPKKWALAALVRAGQLGRTGDTILLARRERSPLEEALAATTHLASPVLALKTGAPSDHRQIVIQVTTPDGRPATFAKLGASPGAREALSVAGERLEELTIHPDVGGFIPRIVGRFDVPGATVLAQTPGPLAVGPTTYGVRHQEFLQALAAATSRTMLLRNSTMWRALRREHAEVAPRAPAAWRQRLDRVIGAVDAVADEEIPLWMAHRDFAPWNTRAYPDGRLFVFDWEVAQPESVPFYDLMHFELSTYALLTRRPDPGRALDRVRSGLAAWRWPTAARESTCLTAYLADRAISRLRYALSRPRPDNALRTDGFLQLVGELLDRVDGGAH